MYIISQGQAKLFVEYLQGLQGSIREEAPVFLTAKIYGGDDVTLSLQSYKSPGTMGICLEFRARPLEMVILDTGFIPVNWKDPSEIDNLICQIRSVGGCRAYNILPSGLDNGRVIRDATIHHTMDGYVIIDVAPDNVLCIDSINEPEEVITAFDLLQKVATAIGHPIVFDSITRSKLTLEYFDDICVNTSLRRKS